MNVKLKWDLIYLTANALIGRFLGYGRDWLILKYFGLGSSADNLLWYIAFVELFTTLFSPQTIYPVSSKSFYNRLNERQKIKSAVSLFNFLAYACILSISLIMCIFGNSNANMDYIFCAGAAIFNVKHYMMLLALQHLKIFKPSSLNNIFINTNIIISIVGELCMPGSFSLMMAVTHFTRYICFHRINNRIYRLLNRGNYTSNFKYNTFDWKYNLLSRYLAFFIVGLIPISDKLILSLGKTGYLSGYIICERIFLLPISIILSPAINRLIPIFQLILKDQIRFEQTKPSNNILIKIFALIIILNCGLYASSAYVSEAILWFGNESSISKVELTKIYNKLMLGFLPYITSVITTTVAFSCLESRFIYYHTLGIVLFKSITYYVCHFVHTSPLYLINYNNLLYCLATVNIALFVIKKTQIKKICA